DLAPAAVDLARARGAQVLHASVHDPLLDGTRWSTVLLADGNIGIGGDPQALLRRSAALLAPGGRVVVELDPPATPTRQVVVRLESGEQASSWFTWAHVAVDDVASVAASAGLQAVETWSAAGRHFASLRLPVAAQVAA
ncbi:MAG: Methyltransferase type 11, partial [Frankiales bacterium]|nr:Methyltransferase type 11 [Frankiales bacterium]